MITVHETPERQAVAYVKGAPAALLAASSNQLTAAGVSVLTAGDRQRFLDGNQELAGAGLRVLPWPTRSCRVLTERVTSSAT